MKQYRFYSMFVLLVSICSVFNLSASPYNSDILTERGIHPNLLNLSVSTFRQKVGFSMLVDHSIHIGNKKSNYQYKFTYDPFTDYGIDLVVQIKKDQADKKTQKKVRDDLENMMNIQSYLQADKLYDENSLKIESESETLTIVSFKLDKDKLPRELSYLFKMQGLVYINSQGLDKITLTNQSPFYNEGIDIELFEQVQTFQKMPDFGGYLLDSEQLAISGERKGERYETVRHAKVTTYYYQNNEKFVINETAQQQLQQDVLSATGSYDTIKVNLDRLFPIYGKEARKEGYLLPKPFGVTLVTMFQNTNMHMTDFKLNDEDINHLVGGENAKVKSASNIALVRMDMWLLPFLNVSLLVGNSFSSNDVNFTACPDKCSVELPGPLPPLELGPYDVQGTGDTKTFLYGVGATIAGGIGDYFSTVDFQYVTSYTEAADAEMSMLVITPMFGYNFTNYHTQVYAGAMYQDQKEHIIATIDGNEVIVGLRVEKWAGMAGVNVDIDRHWNAGLMLSYGEDIQNASLMLGYRF